MSDYPTNVFIFGAGCSADAGIPLLGNFIDKMFEYSFRGRVNQTSIPEPTLSLLKKSNEIRLGFEKYQSRASFDTRNLEDVLSLLSFEKLKNTTHTEDNYNTFVKEVASTIELSCTVKHKVNPSIDEHRKHDLYDRFCTYLLSKHIDHLPAIVTFNYDLVIERAIWDACHFHPGKGEFNIPITFSIDYGFPTQYNVIFTESEGTKRQDGSQAPKPMFHPELLSPRIPYYKLHGSLNWPRSSPQSGIQLSPTEVCDDPLILPPVFNKMATPEINNVWSRALETIRNAINIIIVGYSLPKTDIYMQYFLKSAVGPNANLSRVVVFNPVLFQEGQASDEMRQRYAECFSQPFQYRIEYRPLERSNIDV